MATDQKIKDLEAKLVQWWDEKLTNRCGMQDYAPRAIKVLENEIERLEREDD